MQVASSSLLFNHPFTALVAGPTGCGKTAFVRDFLKFHRQLIQIDQPKKLKVLWCYGIYQKTYDIPILNCEVTYLHGIPSESEIAENLPDFVILDDLMTESSNTTEVSNLFTRGSHHLGFSVILIVQNLFAKGKEMRNISLNSQIIVLMKNRRDLNQIRSLGSQLFPSKLKRFLAVYEDATKRPYGYLLIDTTQQTLEEFRLRTNVIPNNSSITQTVYSI